MVLLKNILKKDVQLISLTVFCFCFTSFSLPLLVGGGQSRTLEAVIYEYLKNRELWPVALGLLAFEILCIFILSLFIYRYSSPLKSLKPVSLFQFRPGLLVGILPCIFVFSGLLEGLFYFEKVFQFKVLFEAFLSTLLLSLFTGAMVILFFIFISFCSQVQYLKKFLIGYACPSVVLTGFAFIILNPPWVYASWVFGLSILFFPSLYRWAGNSVLQGLSRQVQTAQSLGISAGPIFKRIIWPQASKHFFLFGGVASFWACGDFAFTMMTSQGETNLAILSWQLLGYYRLEEGLAVIWLILLAGVLSFLFFKGVAQWVERVLETNSLGRES